jgi:hypothetical protein
MEGGIRSVTDWDVIIPHGLVEIWMDKGNPWWAGQREAVGDVPQVAARHQDNGSPKRPATRPQVRVSYSSRLPSSGMRELDHVLWVNRTALLDRRYAVRVESPEPGVLSLQTSNACLEWRMWAIQLALLRANASFVHAAALERDGKAMLFPSWANVGKTALVKRFVDKLGFRLLGDDLAIVTADGQCFGYPKPMGICAYHKDVYPEFFARHRRAMAPRFLHPFLTWVTLRLKPALRQFPGILQFARRHNPRVSYVPPSEVFGMECLARRAGIEAIVWLDRAATASEPILVRADKSLASRIIGSTLNEIDPWCVQVTNVACGLGLLDFQQIYPAWHDVIERSLNGVQTWMLYLPDRVPVKKISDVVENTLAKANLV